MKDKKFMLEVFELAREGMALNAGGPFGAVVVKEDKIIGKGYNKVTSTNDPTAHAEIIAIKNACKNLGTYQLDNCTIYTSCEPCPMCLGAIYWAKLKRIVFACSRKDASSIDFDDDFIYEELLLPFEKRSIKTEQYFREKGLEILKEWKEKPNKEKY